jgi:hypothetical protein
MCVCEKCFFLLMSLKYVPFRKYQFVVQNMSVENVSVKKTQYRQKNSYTPLSWRFQVRNPLQSASLLGDLYSF